MDLNMPCMNLEIRPASSLPSICDYLRLIDFSNTEFERSELVCEHAIINHDESTAYDTLPSMSLPPSTGDPVRTWTPDEDDTLNPAELDLDWALDPQPQSPRSPTSQAVKPPPLSTPASPRTRRKNNALSASMSRKRAKIFLRMVVVTLQQEHMLLKQQRVIMRQLLTADEWPQKKKLVEQALEKLDNESSVWQNEAFLLEMQTQLERSVDGASGVNELQQLRSVSRRP